MSDDRLKFESKEEFRAACRALSGRMHYLNRVAMGEQRFAWEVADMIERLGRVFDEHFENKETLKRFGDGYSKGSIERDDAAVALFALMYPDKD